MVTNTPFTLLHSNSLFITNKVTTFARSVFSELHASREGEMAGQEREPCPWRIVDDAGGAFAFGFVGGTVYHAIGGARNAPKGHMISQAVSRVKARVPILGGSFAIWGTLFSCFARS